MLSATALAGGSTVAVAPAAPPPAATPASPPPAPTAAAPVVVPLGASTNTGSASAALQGTTTAGPASTGQAGSLNVPPSETGGGSVASTPASGGGGGESGPQDDVEDTTFQAYRPPGVQAQWGNVLDVLGNTAPKQATQVQLIFADPRGFFS